MFAMRLDQRTGAVLWLNDPIFGPAASTFAGPMLAANGTIYIGAGSGASCLSSGCGGVDDDSDWFVVALGVANGDVEWTSVPFPETTRDRITSLELRQGTLVAAGQCDDHTHCVVGLDPSSGEPLWRAGAGPAPFGSFGLGSYPAIAGFAGPGAIVFGGYADFPDGSEYVGWRVSRADVPIIDAVFESGFE
jgi:outer membrane protein assembly factor BamB